MLEKDPRERIIELARELRDCLKGLNEGHETEAEGEKIINQMVAAVDELDEDSDKSKYSN